MKKRLYIVVILLLGAVILAGCGEEPEQDDPNEEKEIKSDKQKTEVSSSFEKLTVKEAKGIVLENLNNINHTMEKNSKNKNEWYKLIIESGNKRVLDKDSALYKKAFKETESWLKDFVAPDKLPEVADQNLYTYFCGCDDWTSITADDIQLRFSIDHQTKNSFKVSYLRLATEAGYKSPATLTATYKHVGGKWKFNGIKEESPEKKPFQLTAEEVKQYYENLGNQSVQLVDKVVKDNKKFHIVKMGDFYQARNAADSSINYDLVQEYKESPKVSSSDESENEIVEEYKKEKAEKDKRFFNSLAVQENLTPDNFKEYLGTWSTFQDSSQPYTNVKMKSAGDKVEIEVMHATAGEVRLIGYSGKTVFSSGEGHFYAEDNQGDSRDVYITLLKDGIAVKGLIHIGGNKSKANEYEFEIHRKQVAGN